MKTLKTMSSGFALFGLCLSYSVIRLLTPRLVVVPSHPRYPAKSSVE